MGVNRAGNQTIEKRTNQGVQTGRETNPKEERVRTKNPRRRITNPGKGQERQREEKKRKLRKKQKNKKTESEIDKQLIRLVPVVVWRLPNLASICPKHYHGFSRENDVIQISNRKQTRRKRREILRVNMIMHCHLLVVMIRNQNAKGKKETPRRIKILEKEETESQRRERRAKGKEETPKKIKILQKEETES